MVWHAGFQRQDIVKVTILTVHIYLINYYERLLCPTNLRHTYQPTSVILLPTRLRFGTWGIPTCGSTIQTTLSIQTMVPHTQRIEGVWEVRIKHYLKAMRGLKGEQLQSYLDMFMWRNWYFPANATGVMSCISRD